MITSFIIHRQDPRQGSGHFPEKQYCAGSLPNAYLKRNSRMPAQPAWFHRLDEILETLRGMESSHLDRQAVQKLFGVRERRARQLMAGLPGLRAGNAFAVARLALIARLEETAQGGLFQWATNRRARVVEELDRPRRHLAARRGLLPASAGVPGNVGAGPGGPQ